MCPVHDPNSLGQHQGGRVAFSIITRLSSHYNLSGRKRSTANKSYEQSHNFQTAVPLESAAIIFLPILLALVSPYMLRSIWLFLASDKWKMLGFEQGASAVATQSLREPGKIHGQTFLRSYEINVQIKDRAVDLHELCEWHFFSLALIKLLRVDFIKKMVQFSCPLCSLELAVKELHYRVCYHVSGCVRCVTFTSNSSKTQQRSNLETVTLFILLSCKNDQESVRLYSGQLALRCL